MPNSTAPRGFVPRMSAIGQAWAATINAYPIASGYATNIFTRDVVKLLPAGTIAKAAAADQMRGVAQWFKWTDPTGKAVVSPYWPAGTVTLGGKPAYAGIIDDPNTIFEARFLNSTSVPAQADQGATFASFDGGGVTATGQSGAGVDYATLAATAQQWRFMGFATSPDNDTTTANSLGLFMPALHDLRVNTGI